MRKQIKRLFMRNFIVLLVIFISVSISWAQEKQIKVNGVIVDELNEPLIGASVSVVGSTNTRGVITDRNGRFSINTTPNSILKVSFLSFVTQNINVRNNTELRIVLLEDTKTLDEVVVTAMGITREAKSLSYARQSIDVESMTEVRGSSLLDMLSGKAAGMQIVSGGGPLASTRVIIRGNNSLTGNNQPLYVVDGVPILNNSGESGDLDFGSPVNSINPDEIENIEILKGANASALYGSDAANGVVLITTKKGSRKQGLGISYGFNAMFGSLYNYPTYQNIYGAGQGNRFQRSQGVNYFGNSNNGVSFNPNLPYGIWNPNQVNQDNRSWGYPMLGIDVVGRNGEVKSYVPHKETIENMYQTSQALTHSFSIDKLTDIMSLRFSYTNQSADDILEKFNLLNRHNFNIRNTTKITNFLDIDATIRYVNEDVENRGFRNASSRNPLYAIANLPRDASIEELIPWKQVDGTPFNFNGFNNPYWLLNETSNADEKNSFMGNLTVNIKLNKMFRVRLRGATDTQNSQGWDFSNLYSPFDTDGEYAKWSRAWVNNNFDGLLSFNKNINKDLNINSNVGVSSQSISGERISSRAFMLILPDKPTLSNATGLISTLEEPERKQKQAVFGVANLGYKNYLYIDATARNEWSSTLPKSNYSYFYYSLGTGLVMSEMLKLNSNTLSFWKLRASFAQVGNDTGFDRLMTGYYRPANGGSFLGLPYYVGEDILKNPNLKPEQTQSWEAGTEFRLWNGRVSADLTYYNKRTRNQIVEADAPLASGYRREILNAGEIKNWGTEVSLTVVPVRTKKVNWSTIINWSRNNSEVLSLVEGVDRYEMGSGDNIRSYAEVGKPYGVFYGNDYKRNADGAIYVGADGKPRFNADQYLGVIQPKWFGGWQNTINIGKFNFSTMLDFQSGGKVWSYTSFRGGIDGNTVQTLDGRWEYTMSELILGENSEERRGFLQPGHTVKPGANYDQNFVAYPDLRPKGVQLGNTVYDPSVSAFWAEKPSMAWVSPNDHWTHNSQSSADRYIYDASYIKLREVSVGYDLSTKWMNKTPIKNARISLVGRNVAILFQNTPKGIDPQATSTTGNAQGFERGFNLPMSNWGFDVRLSF